jgi:hypothetical protein
MGTPLRNQRGCFEVLLRCIVPVPYSIGSTLNNLRKSGGITPRRGGFHPSAFFHP